MTKCWNCLTEVIFEGGEDTKHCDKCGYEVDRINQAITKEEPVIPEGKGGQFAPFIKLPNPLENKVGEIAVGDKVTVVDEFAPPTSEKLKSALIGVVKLDGGQERTCGLNWTSYYTLAGVLGRDTKDWVGSFITYKGLKKFEKGTGHLWVVEK